MNTLIKNLLNVKKDFGFVTRAVMFILLALIICTCSGPRLMLGSQTLEKRTDYSLYSGRHARQIRDATEFAISRIDGLDLASCQALRLLTKQLYLPTLDSESYRKLVQMQRRCLPIRSYQYQYIIPSSSNQYRMEWIAPRQSWPTVSQHPNSQESPSPVQPSPKSSKVSIQQ